MARECITPLFVIFDSIKDILVKMKNEKEWLSNPELSKLLHMSESTIQQFKDRPGLIPYREQTKKGYRFKNCPEMIKLLFAYKYRNFEYEKNILRERRKNEIRANKDIYSNKKQTK